MIGYSHEKYGDYFWVNNCTEDKDISLTVYLWDKKANDWNKVGDVSVSGFLKCESIESEYEHKFKKYEWYAIVANNGKKYEYVGRRKLQNLYIVQNHITVLNVFSTEELPEDVRNSAYVFEPKNISGKFRDAVKFFNKSSDSNMNFYLYGFNDKDDKVWKKLGLSDLKENGDSDQMDCELTGEYIGSFNYLAVVAENGKTYEYDIKKKSNDLYIEVK